jgi:hypothetical protein
MILRINGGTVQLTYRIKEWIKEQTKMGYPHTQQMVITNVENHTAKEKERRERGKGR